jgi:hypothetical protein
MLALYLRLVFDQKMIAQKLGVEGFWMGLRPIFG